MQEHTKGRKGLYRDWLEPHNLRRIEGWARDGMTEKQIAAQMGIAVQTLMKWKNLYDSFGAALKMGKDAIDRQVESALLSKALGDAMATETLYEFDEYGNKVPVRVIEKKAPQDTAAMIFWLKNRKNEAWRDRIENEHTIVANELSEEEQMKRIAELQKKIENAK